jgi:PAS domain S-box-containing protein
VTDEPSRSTACLLNVDDSDGARYVKSRILTLAGYEVVEARTGQEALDKAESVRPDLILLDVKLPDINGLEVCRRLKAAPATRSILVLQTSASLVDSAHRVKALEAGADSYLVDPIDPEELVANVKALLRLKHAEEGHRRAESALSESEERFRQLAEGITDVFWVLSTKPMNFLYVSPAYEALWKRDPKTLYADSQCWFSNMHVDDIDRMRDRFAAFTGNNGYEEEYRTSGPEGERWFSERTFPILDENGHAYRFAGITQNITERKRAELMLIEADRHKDEFLAMLSHELRNPLAPIRSAVDLMLGNGIHFEAARNAVRIIDRQVSHLARLVEDLLDVARINQGKILLYTQPVKIDGVLASAVETARVTMKARRHVLRYALTDTPLWVRGDAVRLSQVIGNLLHNAAKFTPDGGEITVAAQVRDGRVDISVHDNGMGIAPELLPRVFDLFIQADHALHRSQGGLGIGLSLVKRIVAMHGGDVLAESDGLGMGSTFTVSLPLCEAPADEAAASPVPKPARGLRVLVVDDNVDAAEAIGMLLEASGYDVHTATESADALEQAKALAPDVVLLDIGLPVMDGYEVAKALRAMTFERLPVLIALSGYGRDSDRVKAREAGFQHHLVKPADINQLLKIMDTV